MRNQYVSPQRSFVAASTLQPVTISPVTPVVSTVGDVDALPVPYCGVNGQHPELHAQQHHQPHHKQFVIVPHNVQAQPPFDAVDQLALSCKYSAAQMQPGAAFVASPHHSQQQQQLLRNPVSTSSPPTTAVPCLAQLDPSQLMNTPYYARLVRLIATETGTCIKSHIV